jgi:hypothetical protein
MKPLFERQFINTMIRGTLYILNDTHRMADREGALQFILEKSGATTEDEIGAKMRELSCDEAMIINVGMSKFMVPSFSYIRG